METEDTAKLAKTVLVKDIQSKGASELVKALYEDPDPLKNKVATILNAMFTQQRITFLLSKGVANTLILEDPNHNFKGVNSETYKMIIHKLLTGWGFFIRLREPTRKQAGVMELVDEGLLDIMYRMKGKLYYSAQRKVTLELFDNYENEDKPKEAKIEKVKSFADYVEDDRWKNKTVDVSNAVLTKEIIDESAEKIIKESGSEPRKIFE